MRPAVNSATVAALFVGLLVGGALVYGTPVIIKDFAPTMTVTSVSTSTATFTMPVTQTVTTFLPQTTVTQTTVVVITQNLDTTAVTTTQFGTAGVNDVVQSCGAFGNPSETVSCSLAHSVTSGHLLLVEIAEFPGILSPVTTTTTITTTTPTTTTLTTTGTQGQTTLPPPHATLSDSMGNGFTLIAGATQPGSTYVLYFYLTNIATSGRDQVTLAGQGNYPFLLVHELQGVNRLVGFSTGTGNSAAPSVAPYSPSGATFVIAGTFVLNNRSAMAATVGAGAGNALADTTFGIADEYQTAVSSITSPFVMTNSIPWAEVSVAFG